MVRVAIYRLPAAGLADLGAVVMGTGIVSVALSLVGFEPLSLALLAVATGVWAALAAGVVAASLRDRAALVAAARRPSGLTSVAATAVLGDRLLLAGRPVVAEVALVVAVCLGAGLVPRVLRAWTRPTRGTAFLLCVSTEALAALAAADAVGRRQAWLATAALVLLGLGLLAYGFVLRGFDPRELLRGAGDHWIAGGALAIATLACADVARAAAAIPALAPARAPLTDLALASWAAASVWLPALLAGEACRPRLGYDARRWSTVFPLGMYAASSYVAGEAAAVGGLVDFARVWAWLAFAVWTIVAVGGLSHRSAAGTLLRSPAIERWRRRVT